MIIYTDKISPRFLYCCDYIFNHRLSIPFQVITNESEFEKATDFKIAYTKKHINSHVQFYPEGLLFEKELRTTKPSIKMLGEQVYLFPDDSTFGFDIFSATFWMLIRYEEYQAFKPDKHGRFPATESFAYRHGFLQQPVVDEWVLMLKNQLQKLEPNLQMKTENYTFFATFDIDSPWCYKHKGWVRNTLGFVRDLLNADFAQLNSRLATLLGIKNDEWFQFNWIHEILKKYHLKPYYFLHVGAYGKYDKTIRSSKKVFKKFVQNTVKYANISWHPSYRAANDTSVFLSEKKQLERILLSSVNSSRQHYLKIGFPDYFEQINNAGVQHDYSLGFADAPGFRAGTSRPFYFYNLKSDKKSDLMLHPFCIMDRTLKSYQQLTFTQIEKVYADFTLSLKKVNGMFVTLWHNETFSEQREWRGWKKLFEKVLKLAS